MISRTNMLLGVLLVILIAASVFLRVDYSKPNIEILPDMKYSPAWDAYAVNPNFSNGRTLQAPPAGTIARGQMPIHYTASKADALRAGEELRNPFPREVSGSAKKSDESAESKKKNAENKRAYQQSVQRGANVFRVFCTSCHGPQGAGDGPVAKRGFPPPPSLITGKSQKMKDGQLFHILTYGQQSMAPMAAQLAPSRRWDVVNFVRSLQSKQAPGPTVPAPTAKQAGSTDETKK